MCLRSETDREERKEDETGNQPQKSKEMKVLLQRGYGDPGTLMETTYVIRFGERLVACPCCFKLHAGNLNDHFHCESCKVYYWVDDWSNVAEMNR